MVLRQQTHMGRPALGGFLIKAADQYHLVHAKACNQKGLGPDAPYRHSVREQADLREFHRARPAARAACRVGASFGSTPMMRT